MARRRIATACCRCRPAPGGRRYNADGNNSKEPFMKLAIITTTLATLAMLAAPAQATEVGVSVQISQPGVYGRIDIGRFPQPQVVLPQPVIITRPVVVAPAPPQPVYMWVPPGHRKDWRKHCGKYNACGVPVYFVRDDWYDGHVHPKGKGKHKGDDHPGKGKGKDKD
jgi:hypothetical protein